MVRIRVLTGILTALLCLCLTGTALAAEETPSELDDALAETAGGDCAALDMKQLRKLFGEDIRLSTSDQSGSYRPASESLAGTVELPADGQRHYVLIEDEEGMVLWAGIHDGENDSAPRSPLNWETTEEKDAKNVEPDELTLDISDVQKVYGPDVQVQTAEKGRGYSLANPDEDGHCLIHIEGEEKYVLIALRQQDAAGEIYLWGGVFSKTGVRSTIKFHVNEQETGLVGSEPFFTPAPSATPEATVEPSPSPEPEVEPVIVQVEPCEAVYDGKPHSPQVSGKDVTYFYVLCDAYDDEPPADEGEKGLPTLTDAGELWAFVRAETENAPVRYQDDQEKTIADVDGWVKTYVRVKPAAVALTLRADMDEQAVYTGKPQQISVRLAVDTVEDKTGLFDKEGLEESRNGNDTVTVTGCDAGTYPVEPSQEMLTAIQDYDPNFSVTVRWDDATVEIQPKPIQLKSASAATVYVPSDGPLTAGESVQGVRQIANGDYYSGDILAQGEQHGVGIGRNTICLGSTFAQRKDNYTFDLEAGAGTLVVFPQSISGSAPHWDDVGGDVDPNDYADADLEDLPGFYDGMQILLEAETAEYDGEEKTVVLRFTDQHGASVQMREGQDYTVQYLRDGAASDDLVEPGAVTVVVTGQGSYTGKVELTFEILPRQLKDAAIQIRSWTYDGKAAGSDDHPVIVQGGSSEPVLTYFDEEGSQIDPPSNVGSYTLNAVWEETSKTLEGTAEWSFTINPATVTVKANDGEKVFGESDPELTLSFEGVTEDDSLSCEAVREPGEDVGTYAIRMKTGGISDNYLIDFVPGQFTILPRPIERAQVEWSGGDPLITDGKTPLTKDSDYTLQLTEDETGAGVESLLVTGIGNYTGSVVVDRRVPVELTLALTDETGDPLPQNEIRASGEELADVFGVISADKAVASDRMSVHIGGGEAVGVTQIDEKTCFFSVRGLVLDASANELSLSVLLDGEEAVTAVVPIRRAAGAGLWMGLAGGSALCAAISLGIFVWLTAALRKEQAKKREKTASQDERTIQ